MNKQTNKIQLPWPQSFYKECGDPKATERLPSSPVHFAPSLPMTKIGAANHANPSEIDSPRKKINPERFESPCLRAFALYKKKIFPKIFFFLVGCLGEFCILFQLYLILKRFILLPVFIGSVKALSYYLLISFNPHTHKVFFLRILQFKNSFVMSISQYMYGTVLLLVHLCPDCYEVW